MMKMSMDDKKRAKVWNSSSNESNSDCSLDDEGKQRPNIGVVHLLNVIKA